MYRTLLWLRNSTAIKLIQKENYNSILSQLVLEMFVTFGFLLVT
jgi:hypothetical protein